MFINVTSHPFIKVGRHRKNTETREIQKAKKRGTKGGKIKNTTLKLSPIAPRNFHLSLRVPLWGSKLFLYQLRTTTNPSSLPPKPPLKPSSFTLLFFSKFTSLSNQQNSQQYPHNTTKIHSQISPSQHKPLHVSGKLQQSIHSQSTPNRNSISTAVTIPAEIP